MTSDLVESAYLAESLDYPRTPAYCVSPFLTVVTFELLKLSKLFISLFRNNRFFRMSEQQLCELFTQTYRDIGCRIASLFPIVSKLEKNYPNCKKLGILIMLFYI